MVRALVTGGLGFIGSHLVDALVSQRKEVAVIDALRMGSSIGNSNSLAEYVVIDLANRQKVVSWLTDKSNHFDEVYHLAAESHVDRAINNAQPFIDSNITGTYNLFTGLVMRKELTSPTRVPKVLLFSTDEVMGEMVTGSFSEQDATAPKNLYSMTKLAQEGIARSFFHSHGIPVVTTRCSNIYGPRQDDEKFIPTIIRTARDVSAQVPVYGDGMNRREWTYIDDAISATLFAMHAVNSGDTIHIGTGDERTNLQVVHQILQTINPKSKRDYIDSKIKFVEDRKGHDKRYALNSKKLKKLGWLPKFNFDKGLKLTIKSY